MIQPENDESADSLTTRLRSTVEEVGGAWDRSENWGRCALAYPIGKLTKATYVLLNFTVDSETAKKLLPSMEETLSLDDTVIRSLVFRSATAQTEPSIVMQKHAQETVASQNEAKQDKPAIQP